MNKLYIILAVVLVLLITVLGWWFSNTPPTTQVIVNSPTPVVHSFLLTVIDDNVQVKEATDTDFKKVEGQTATLHEQATARTLFTGRAIIEGGDGTTIAIDKNSEFTIAKAEANQTSIGLLSGNLWAKVQKLFGQGEYFQVETPNAVATVRGTSFGVFFKNNVTTVITTEGRVLLVSIDPKTKEPIGQEVAVTEGNKGTVTTGREAKLETTSANDKKLEWYAYNNPLATPSPTPGASASPKPSAKPMVSPVVLPAPTPTPPSPIAITCSTNSQCGTDGLKGFNYCQNGNVYNNYLAYTCSNPGTAASACSSTTTPKLMVTCATGQTCSAGKCQGAANPNPPGQTRP